MRPVAAVGTGDPVRAIAVPAVRPIAVRAGAIRPIASVTIARSATVTAEAVGATRSVVFPCGPIIRGVSTASGLRTALEGLGGLVGAAGRGGPARRPVGVAARGRCAGTTSTIGALVGAILLAEPLAPIRSLAPTRSLAPIRSLGPCLAFCPDLVVSCRAIAGSGGVRPALAGRLVRMLGAVAVGGIGHDVLPVVGI